MGLVNHSVLPSRQLRREYVQAAGAILFLVAFSLLFGPTPHLLVASSGKPEIRMAFFPNLTHAPALIGTLNHTFERSLPRYEISSKVVNAGPEAMEAMAAGAVDVAYVGPSPALNSFLRSNGSALRIISGVCENGAALISRKGLRISSVADLDGKNVAVPEFGGTQDVSLRHFLQLNHLASRETGGTVEILPIKNPEILALFKQGQLDAAWVPEPWASRLVQKAGGKVVVEESQLWPNHKFATTVMVASTNFINEHPDAVDQLVSDNRSIIRWISGHPEEAKLDANNQIGKLTGKPLDRRIVDAAWKNLTFSDFNDRASVESFGLAARSAGYLKSDLGLVSKIWLNPISGSVADRRP